MFGITECEQLFHLPEISVIVVGFVVCFWHGCSNLSRCARWDSSAVILTTTEWHQSILLRKSHSHTRGVCSCWNVAPCLFQCMNMTPVISRLYIWMHVAYNICARMWRYSSQLHYTSDIKSITMLKTKVSKYFAWSVVILRLAIWLRSSFNR